MALIKCPECEKEVSSEALSCPHCGYSLIKNKYAEKLENTKDKANGFIRVNKRKITIFVVSILIVLITIGIIKDIMHNKQLEYDLSLDAYTTIVDCLRDYKYATHRIEQLNPPSGADEIKEYVEAKASLELYIDDIEYKYDWLNSTHKSELKEWISINLDGNEKSDIYSKLTNTEIKEFFNWDLNPIKLQKTKK